MSHGWNKLKISVFLELPLLALWVIYITNLDLPGKKKQDIPKRNTDLVIQPVTKEDPQAFSESRLQPLWIQVAWKLTPPQKMATHSRKCQHLHAVEDHPRTRNYSVAPTDKPWMAIWKGFRDDPPSTAATTIPSWICFLFMSFASELSVVIWYPGSTQWDWDETQGWWICMIRVGGFNTSCPWVRAKCRVKFKNICSRHLNVDKKNQSHCVFCFKWLSSLFRYDWFLFRWWFSGVANDLIN